MIKIKKPAYQMQALVRKFCRENNYWVLLFAKSLIVFLTLPVNFRVST